MQTVRVSEKSGDDGVLRLQIPVGNPEAEYEAVVVLHPRSGEDSRTVAEGLGWPDGYFETTYGSIDDDTFVRPPQGSLPDPVDLG
jgi:hypothetical protein